MNSSVWYSIKNDHSKHFAPLPRSNTATGLARREVSGVSESADDRSEHCRTDVASGVRLLRSIARRAEKARTCPPVLSTVFITYGTRRFCVA
jgi:hypothetical protein